jgi:TonB family protein
MINSPLFLFVGMLRILEHFMVKENSANRWGYLRYKKPVMVKPRSDKGENMTKKRFLILIISLISIWTASCGVQEKGDTLLSFFPDNRHGLINAQGDVIVPPQFDFILEFGDGLAGVRTGSKWGFIGRDGKFVIEPRFQFIRGSFSGGLACVMENYKYGYIDKHGQWKIKPRFNDAYKFREGVAEVEIDGKTGFIDTNGQFVVNPEFARVGHFSEGLAPVKKTLLGKWGYIDKKGNWVIPPTYDYAYSFSEGVAAVKKNVKYGFIDKTGKVVLDFKYDFVDDFSENLARVSINKKDGYINHAGEFVIPLRFDSASSFSECLAAVGVGSLFGFIDTKGNMVIKPKFVLVLSPFKDGVTMVGLGVSGRKGIVGYIDKKGNIIKQWSFDPSESLKGSHPPMNPNPAPQTITPAESLPVLEVGGITGRPSPKIIKRVELEYPKEAVENRIQGLVVVNIVIDIYGKVTDARAIVGPDLLRAAAENTVKRWIFEPTIIDGVPRKVAMAVVIKFKL